MALRSERVLAYLEQRNRRATRFRHAIATRVCRNALIVCQFANYEPRLNARIGALRCPLHGVQMQSRVHSLLALNGEISGADLHQSVGGSDSPTLRIIISSLLRVGPPARILRDAANHPAFETRGSGSP